MTSLTQAKRDAFGIKTMDEAQKDGPWPRLLLPPLHLADSKVTDYLTDHEIVEQAKEFRGFSILPDTLIPNDNPATYPRTMYYGWLFTEEMEDNISEIAKTFDCPWYGDESTSPVEPADSDCESTDMALADDAPPRTGWFTEEEREDREQIYQTMRSVLIVITQRLSRKYDIPAEELALFLECKLVTMPDGREDSRYLIAVCTNHDVDDTSPVLVQDVQQMLELKENPKWYAEWTWLARLRAGVFFRDMERRNAERQS